jgi:hypothetical protein
MALSQKFITNLSLLLILATSAHAFAQNSPEPVVPAVVPEQAKKKPRTLADYFKPADTQKWQRQIKEKVAALDVKASANLFDLSFSDAASIGMKYRIALEPGYKHNFHSRIDTWQLQTALTLGDYLRSVVGEDFPVFLNFEKGAEVSFLRQFPTKSEALKATPYTIQQLPTTADRALKYLKVGEMASMPAQTSIVVGARIVSHLQYLKAQFTPVGAILRGGFTFQVFRAQEQKLRLRVFANTATVGFRDASAKLSFDVFGLGIIDGVVDGITPLTVLNYRNAEEAGQILLFDFAFDTSDPQAKEAFNQAMQATLEFKDVELFKEFMSSGGSVDPKMAAFCSLKQAEDLADQDAESQNPRVEQLSQVQNRYTRSVRSLKYGLLVAHWRNERNYVENFISIADKKGIVRNFFNPSFVTYESSRFGISSVSTNNELRRTYFAIMDSGSDSKDLYFSHLGYVYDRNEAHFSLEEQQRLRNLVRSHLPIELFSQIDWKNWDWSSALTGPRPDRNGTRVYFQFLLKASAIPLLKRFTKADFYSQIQPRVEIAYGRNQKADKVRKATDFIVERAYSAINDAKLTEQQRVSLLLELRNSPIFSGVGLSFLTGLLTADEIVQHAYLDFQMFAEDGQQVKFTFGTPDSTGIYSVVRDIDQVLNDRNLDPRAFEQTENGF